MTEGDVTEGDVTDGVGSNPGGRGGRRNARGGTGASESPAFRVGDAAPCSSCGAQSERPLTSVPADRPARPGCLRVVSETSARVVVSESSFPSCFRVVFRVARSVEVQVAVDAGEAAVEARVRAVLLPLELAQPRPWRIILHYTVLTTLYLIVITL